VIRKPQLIIEPGGSLFDCFHEIYMKIPCYKSCKENRKNAVPWSLHAISRNTCAPAAELMRELGADPYPYAKHWKPFQRPSIVCD